MSPIRPIKTMVTVGPCHEQARGAEFSQLILNRVQGEAAQDHEFGHVAMLLWLPEK